MAESTGIASILTTCATILTELLSMMATVLTWVVTQPVIMFFMGFSIVGLVIAYAQKVKGF